jgi:AcrR family transcriptional regulator
MASPGAGAVARQATTGTGLDRAAETCSYIGRKGDMEERARRIVETAVELAEQGGFEAVRLRDVAAHAGVALGTLYRRFRSKEDLLLAALEQLVSEHEARLAQRPPEGDTPLERLTTFFQMTTRALCRRPNLARALVRAIATGEPELTRRVAGFHTVMARLIAAALRGDRATTDGVVPSAEETAIADVLQRVWFASLVGWSNGLHAQPAIVDQTRNAAQLLLRPGGPPPA